ncbi:hypothetical protein ACHAO2_008010 [Verticillium nonalfalfae]
MFVEGTVEAMSREEIETLLPPLAAADIRELNGLVRSGIFHAAVFDPKWYTNAHLCGLWKTTFSAFRETPEHVISMPLQFDPRLNYPMGKFAVINPNPSQGFCMELGELCSHPLWRGEYRILQITIAFTVVCLTNDRRPWPFDVVVDNSTYDSFAAAARQSDGSRSFASLFRRAIRSTPGTYKSELALVFLHIANTVTPEPDLVNRRRNAPAQPIVYNVSVHELHILLMALRTVRCNGIPLYPNPKLHAALHTESRGRTHPHTMNEVHDLRKRSILRECRRNPGVAAPIDISSDSPSESSSDHSSGGFSKFHSKSAPQQVPVVIQPAVDDASKIDLFPDIYNHEPQADNNDATVNEDAPIPSFPKVMPDNKLAFSNDNYRPFEGTSQQREQGQGDQTSPKLLVGPNESSNPMVLIQDTELLSDCGINTCGNRVFFDPVQYKGWEREKVVDPDIFAPRD